MEWPQYLIIIYFIAVMALLVYKHETTIVINAKMMVAEAAVVFGVLVIGGFFGG